MRDLTTERRLRRELDQVLFRLARCGRAALIEARSESDRLAGDVFADAQVVASRDLDELSYERLARRATALAEALERLRDGTYGSCEVCGGRIPDARRRALPDVTTCVRCQESAESATSRPATTERLTRRSRVRHSRDRGTSSNAPPHS